MSSQPEHTSRAVVAALVLTAAVVAYMVVGLTTLDPASRRVPLLAGGVTVALLIAEIVKQLTAGRTRPIPDRGAAPVHARAPATLTRELRVLGSVVALVAGIYLFGFLVAIPLYLLSAIRFVGGIRAQTALIVAVLTSAAIYAAFALLLSYRLFPGVVFS